MSAAIAIAGAGVVMSGINANNANKQAGKALSAQQQMEQQKLDFQREQYQRYLSLFGPTEERLAREANSEQPLDYDKNKAAITTNTDQSLRNISRQMSMRGMAGSGTDVGANRGALMGQGAALSGAYAEGLDKRRNLGLSLTGRGQIGGSANGVASGMQGMSNLFGSQAGMWGGAAQQGWGNFSTGLGELGNMLSKTNKVKPDSVQVDGGGGSPGSAPNWGGGDLSASMQPGYDYLGNGGTPVADGGWV